MSEGAGGNWEKHRQRWEVAEKSTGRSVEFILWTEFNLRNRLIQSNAEGLRGYWFGENEFSSDWFKQRVPSTIAALDESYNRQDHVDVHLQEIFDELVKHPRAIAKLEKQFSRVRRNLELAFPSDRIPSLRNG